MKLMQRPILLGTLGFPGSGKTYFCERLAKKYGYFHLNADRLRLEVFDRPKYNDAENRIFFRIMDFLTEELLSRGVSVIFDANSTRREFRQKFMRLAKKHHARYTLLWFQTPVDIALKRLEQRRHIRGAKKQKYYRAIDTKVLFRIRKQEEAPQNEPHIVIDGSMLFKKQVLQYDQWLRNIIAFPIK